MELSSELSPELFERVEFRERWRGYDPDEVDDFLERAGIAVGRLLAGLREANDRIEKAERRARERDEADEAMRRTLVLAQRTADQAVRESEEQARLTVEAAQSEADVLREAARAEAEALVAEARAEAAELSARAHGDLHQQRVELEAERDRLRAEVEAMEARLTQQRERVAAELRRQLEEFEVGGPAPAGVTPLVEQPPASTPEPAIEGASFEGAPGEADASGDDPVDLDAAEPMAPVLDLRAAVDAVVGEAASDDGAAIDEAHRPDEADVSDEAHRPSGPMKASRRWAAVLLGRDDPAEQGSHDDLAQRRSATP